MRYEVSHIEMRPGVEGESGKRASPWKCNEQWSKAGAEGK